MTKVLDILKIEKTVRKSMKDYAITAKYDEEVLVRLISVDIWLNLNAEDVAPAPKPKRTNSQEVNKEGE